MLSFVYYNPNSFVLDYRLDIIGDIDHNKTLDLRDLIMGLQLLTEIDATVVNIEADVNNDGFIGLEDIIFILHNIYQNQND